MAMSNNNSNASGDWDRIFLRSDKINYQKVTFKNRYGIELVEDLYDNLGKIPFDRIEEFLNKYLLNR